MHGLINRSIEAFIAYTYGPETWAGIASAAELPATGFEPLQSYEDTVTARGSGGRGRRPATRAGRDP
jgi:hypothetical protein